MYKCIDANIEKSKNKIQVFVSGTNSKLDSSSIYVCLYKEIKVILLSKVLTATKYIFIFKFITIYLLVEYIDITYIQHQHLHVYILTIFFSAIWCIYLHIY